MSVLLKKHTYPVYTTKTSRLWGASFVWPKRDKAKLHLFFYNVK